ncbi:MAG: hypothetical protein V7647_1798 [Acidobacteriota bacterium]|jgi:hypothetical protein
MRRNSARSLLCAGGIAVMLVAGVSASHSWGGYHWARQTSQFTLKLGDNLTTATWKGHLAQTSLDWNSGNTPVLTAVVAGQSRKRCSMVAGTSQVCNDSYGRNGWLGLASINIIDGTHITQGSAKMNDTYFNTSTYNNPNEREHVMCQEVAHTFGLAHQSEDGSSQNSCMDYFSNTGANAGSSVSTKPNAHDFQELNIIYQHLDTTTTVAAMAAMTASRVDAGDNEDAKNWGQLVSQSRNGRSSTYERFEQDGSQTLTHVYWTLEAAETCRGCDHRFDH